MPYPNYGPVCHLVSLMGLVTSIRSTVPNIIDAVLGDLGQITWSGSKSETSVVSLQQEQPGTQKCKVPGDSGQQSMSFILPG